MESSDFPKIVEIYKRHFQNEFPFPFEGKRAFLDDKFVVTDDFGNVITFGTLEISLEGVVLTDKSYPIDDRRAALYKLLQALNWSASNSGFDMFHCTIQDEKWIKHLKRAGFKQCKGEYLFYKVG